ncbi:hypothetical protein DA100_19180 [Vibrio sp. Hep-1b-8]|nr:hypothetical protein DA100_19180 [Vibrio sp. Hep-1b-8]
MAKRFGLIPKAMSKWDFENKKSSQWLLFLCAICVTVSKSGLHIVPMGSCFKRSLLDPISAGKVKSLINEMM